MQKRLQLPKLDRCVELADQNAPALPAPNGDWPKTELLRSLPLYFDKLIFLLCLPKIVRNLVALYSSPVADGSNKNN